MVDEAHERAHVGQHALDVTAGAGDDLVDGLAAWLPAFGAHQLHEAGQSGVRVSRGGAERFHEVHVVRGETVASQVDCSIVGQHADRAGLVDRCGGRGFESLAHAPHGLAFDARADRGLRHVELRGDLLLGHALAALLDGQVHVMDLRVEFEAFRRRELRHAVAFAVRAHDRLRLRGGALRGFRVLFQRAADRPIAHSERRGEGHVANRVVLEAEDEVGALLDGHADGVGGEPVLA